MNAFYAYCALSGTDDRCMKYIAKYSVQKTEAAPAASNITLHSAIVSGLKESAYTAAESLLKILPARNY